MVQPLWKTVWRFLKKLKTELPHDLAIPLLDIDLEKTIIQKGSCTKMFIAALFTIARTWKRPKCPPTDEYIKKMCVFVCACTFGFNKEGNPVIFDNMNEPGGYYAK